MGKFELKVLKPSVSCSPKRGRINIPPIIYFRGGSRISSWGGGALKKLGRAEGGAKFFGVLRVKNHDFTPKNHIFSNCGGRCENFWGISCEKITILRQQIIFFPILGGACAGCTPLDPPLYLYS
jgi:hypothetical protein